MHMNRFIAVETIKEKPIRTGDAFDGGHVLC
jgi:hypothetical protein